MLYIFSFIAGLFAVNGVPHFIKGITGQSHSTPFGHPSSPVVNVVWGWVNFLVAMILVHYSHPWVHLYRATACFTVAVLVMAVVLAYTWKPEPGSKKSN